MRDRRRLTGLVLSIVAGCLCALVLSASGGAAQGPDPSALSAQLGSCGNPSDPTSASRECATAVGVQASQGFAAALAAGDPAGAQKMSDVKASAMSYLFVPGQVHPTPQEVSRQLDKAAGVAPAVGLASNERTRSTRKTQNANSIICAPTTGLNSGAGHASETARVDCYHDVIGGGRATVPQVSSFGRLWRLSGSWYVESSHSSTCYGTVGCIDIHTAYNGTGYFQGEGQHYITPPPGYSGNTYAEAWSKVCYIQTGTILNCS